MKRIIKALLILIAAMLLTLIVVIALCPKPNPGKPVPAATQPNQPEEIKHGAR